MASGVYDLLLGGALLFGLDPTLAALEVSRPLFPINANLNGLFALCIGLGYFAIRRNPWEHRWYLWIMGPLLKGGGACLFVVDHLIRESPSVFLVFAVSDGLLAAATALALVRYRRFLRRLAGQPHC